ncbi:MAG: DUF3127 domain-containing protein [Puniceicoccales bacterium]|jgi:hypothetical protein|nr:DUF3127 domain-containing protein [Puniceicoccales bacterium]
MPLSAYGSENPLKTASACANEAGLKSAGVHREPMFEITGTIKKIFEEQTFGSNFNKREFVLTVDAERFPQDIKFECVKDKVGLIAAFKPGDRAKVFFDLRGREWKENYYVNLVAWKIERTDGSSAVAPGDEDVQSVSDPGPEDIPF